jgi:PAS domain S-box-containing protein
VADSSAPSSKKASAGLVGRLAPSFAFLAGGGEMGELMRRMDWSETPLGPTENWPQSLKTAVRIMLTSRQAIWIGWGPELVYVYNDPYQAIIGGKHPKALGQPTKVVWREIWDVIGPMLSTAMAGDEGTYVESQLLIMERHGYREETYYTFSYSPIPDDDGSAGGIICANTDDTRRVIGERQLALLRELAAGTANVQTRQEACVGARQALASNPRDVPFALIFIPSTEEKGLVLAEACGVDRSHAIAADPEAWPLDRVLAGQEILLVDDLQKSFGSDLPTGPWTEAPTRAALIPLAAQGETSRGGVLVVGLNPFRRFDENYRNFLSLVGGQIAASLASAQTYEAERRRAEALAQLDRAKTEFFSNVSHEFRTPLTLMLGPIEDLLEKSYTDLTPATKNQLEIVHRNSLRLMKLVNTLLDFSRLEAGRVEANFAAVDLAAYTAELASGFRGAIERAGLKLVVDCPPLPEMVLIDREMWEKIVLNLLSNAFKFTLAGEIEVRLEATEGEARLTVRDTGVGVPPEEVPRLFERFHRVKESRGRTHEGTGIGLALVQELVRLHAGTIRVESVIDQGTRFIVSVPLGQAHLDSRRIRALPDRPPGNLAAEAFVKEAMRWTDAGEPSPDQAWARDRNASLALSREAAGELRPAGVRARILWADDNADMRDYVSRLLAERFEVTAVSDGQAALEAIRAAPPDLVLSDVMMPRLDGFGLMREIRANPALNTVPVILLSARAGEEARVEGVASGADDYLVKPFSARELLARVESHVKMARFRRETQAATMQLMEEAVQARAQVEKLNHDLRAEIAEREEAHKRLRQRTAQFETLLNQAPLGVYVVDSNFRLRDVNPTARPVFGDIPDLIGRDFQEVIGILWPEAYADEIVRRFRHTLETGESYAIPEWAQDRADRGGTEFYEWRIDRIPVPDGSYGVVAYFRDISDQVHARLALKRARDDALAANRAKDEFIATLSHELRTPLNPVLLVASDAAEDRALAPDVRANFKMIADNTSLQARLIDDLLDFSRIVHGKVALEQRTLDFHAIVRDAAATIRDEISAKKISLVFSLAEPAPIVDGDPVRLRQVFWNVLKNALKFTPSGGRIEISSASAGDAEIRVRDTGIGMGPDELARIFHPFVQGRHTDKNRHEAYGGLGLGLAISRMLVERHGGSIAAESPGPDFGSTIIVRLPRKVLAGAAPSRIETGSERETPSPPPSADHPTPRVLFVEDHEPTRAMLARLLQRRGYDVKAASTVEDALRQADQAVFDVLISDLGLPDGDGCDLMSELRGKYPALPGIAISGFGMDSDLIRSRAAGFKEHLTKPISIDSLDRALARVLSPGR